MVGLGAGTMAAWGRPGDTFRFYEINPDVERIARTWFSFLSDSKAQTEVVLGDARVQLERELAMGRSRRFRLNRGGCVFERFDTDASADGRVRGHLPAASGARWRAGAAYLQSGAGIWIRWRGGWRAIWDGRRCRSCQTTIPRLARAAHDGF